MSLRTGTFFSLTQAKDDANRQVEQFAEQFDESQKRRELVFSRVKQAIDRDEETGKKLDACIESVSALVSQYLSSIKNVKTV